MGIFLQVNGLKTADWDKADPFGSLLDRERGHSLSITAYSTTSGSSVAALSRISVASWR